MKTHCKRGHELSGDNLRVRTERGYQQRNCRKCDLIRRGKSDRTNSGRAEVYEPLDDILRSPTVRVLRAIRFHDWISMSDVAEILGIDGFKERNNLSSVLQNMARFGYVDRHRGLGLRLYRITRRGIEQLERALAKYVEKLDCIELTDEELSERAA